LSILYYISTIQNQMKIVPRIPTHLDIENLRVGDCVYNCFGQLKPVNKIKYRGFDRYGHLFVTFDQEFTVNSTMSNSLTEGEEIYFVHETSNQWKLN
jgi:hypothetical protein